ncbi:pyrroline-5-carboxylate reductase [Caminibacter sp.]
MKISIIGYGAMAKAILSGMENAKWKMENVEVIGRDEHKLKEIEKEFNVKTALIDGYDITGKVVILAVKPYALQEVSMRIKGDAEVLISILAGKPLVELQKYIKAKYYLRAMPNVAAKYSASTTALTGDIEAKEIGEGILSKIGEVVWVNSDDEIDMATAIIGSGPAFLAIIAEAISDAGVYTGLKRDVAIKLTKGLFRSFAALKEDFAEIKNSVMSPKGTTAEGIRALEEEGVRGKVLKGVVKTYEKSKKI